MSDHGTRSRYQAGCPCDDCRTANQEYCAAWRQKNNWTTPPSHGVSGYANYGCRCATCRRAHTEHNYGYTMRARRS